MERSLEVRTGESIGIQYELAGLGSRFLAVSLDFAIQLAVAAVALLVIGFASQAVSRTGIALPVPLTKMSRAVLGAALTFALFALFFGYFIVFELWWSGRTPGKRALRLRVLRDAGFPIDIGAAVIRNLVRVLEFAVAFYALSALSALLSRQNKRLGDFAAGTIVVRDRGDDRPAVAHLLAREHLDDGLEPADRDLIERYVARRETLDRVARQRLAAEIADRVRPKLRASFEHLSDDALLEHLGR